MLKVLAKLLLDARRRKAAWQRWARKLPHNRKGAEPAKPAAFCRPVMLPSGRVELMLTDVEVEHAYRQARYPKPAPEEVAPPVIPEDRVRELYEQYARK